MRFKIVKTEGPSVLDHYQRSTWYWVKPKGIISWFDAHFSTDYYLNSKVLTCFYTKEDAIRMIDHYNAGGFEITEEVVE